MSETKKRFTLKDLKGTKAAAVAEQAEEIKSKGKGKKQEYLQIEEGVNRVRIMPCHPDTDPKNLYAQKREVSWLPFRKEDGSLGRRPVMNAVTHGGQEKDIVACYVRMAPEFIKADRSASSKDKAKKIDALTDFKNGIAPKGSYLMYAKKEEKDKVVRGLLEVTYGVKRKLDALSISDLEEDPEVIDPISDPIDGSVVKITYSPSESNNNKYTVVLDRKASQLTEEDVDWLNDQTPLYEMLVDVYHKGHFDKAVEGLEIYDEQHGIGLFHQDEFQDLISELRSQLPDAPEREDEEDEGDAKPGRKGKRLEDMDRGELKQFILDNELDIRVTRKMTEEDILEAIEEELGFLPEYADEVDGAGKADPVDFDDEEEEEEDERPARRVRRERAKAASYASGYDDDEDPEEEDDTPRARRARRRSMR